MQNEAQDKCKKKVAFWAKIINYLLKDTILMENVETLNAKADALATAVTNLTSTNAAMNLKLDELRAYVQGFVGKVLTQDEADSIGAKLAAVGEGLMIENQNAANNLAEADAIDEPTP